MCNSFCAILFTIITFFVKFSDRCIVLLLCELDFLLQMYNNFFTYANLFSNFQGKHANLNKKPQNAP